MAYEQKTKADTGNVADFLAALDPAKREDSRALSEMMQAATGDEPVLWGSMVGFGRYRYTYASGHSGEAFLVGFAPRKAEFSIYLSADDTSERAALLAQLGKHRMGKGCLYIKRLSDVDSDVLEALVVASVRTLRARYAAQQ